MQNAKCRVQNENANLYRKDSAFCYSAYSRLPSVYFSVALRLPTDFRHRQWPLKCEQHPLQRRVRGGFSPPSQRQAVAKRPSWLLQPPGGKEHSSKLSGKCKNP